MASFLRWLGATIYGHGSGEDMRIARSVEQCCYLWGHFGSPKGRVREEQTSFWSAGWTRQAVTWREREISNQDQPVLCKSEVRLSLSSWLRPWALRMQRDAKSTTLKWPPKAIAGTPGSLATGESGELEWAATISVPVPTPASYVTLGT